MTDTQAHMKELAIKLLKLAHLPLADNADLLAADLATVVWDERLDRYVAHDTETVFVHRLGGLGNLARYMNCLCIQRDQNRGPR